MTYRKSQSPSYASGCCRPALQDLAFICLSRSARKSRTLRRRLRSMVEGWLNSLRSSGLVRHAFDLRLDSRRYRTGKATRKNNATPQSAEVFAYLFYSTVSCRIWAASRCRFAIRFSAFSTSPAFRRTRIATLLWYDSPPFKIGSRPADRSNGLGQG